MISEIPKKTLTKSIKAMCTMLFLFLIVGCSAVYSTKPIGEKPVILTSKDWDGVWINQEGSVYIRVIDANRGLLRVSWIEDSDRGPEIETYKVHIFDSDDWMFANVEDKESSGRYFWGRIKKDDNQIIVWVPEVSKIKTLVEKHVLPGKIKDDGDVVILGDLNSKDIKLITSSSKGILVDWEAPVFFIRIRK